MLLSPVSSWKANFLIIAGSSNKFYFNAFYIRLSMVKSL